MLRRVVMQLSSSDDVNHVPIESARQPQCPIQIGFGWHISATVLRKKVRQKLIFRQHSPNNFDLAGLRALYAGVHFGLVYCTETMLAQERNEFTCEAFGVNCGISATTSEILNLLPAELERLLPAGSNLPQRPAVSTIFF